jgi:superfamily II DNA helicase RecQ
LQKRLIAAAKYFAEQLQNISQYLLSSVAVTDSKQKAMIYNIMLQDIHVAIAQKLYAMKGLEYGFNAEAFAMHKKKFVATNLRVNAYSAANKTVKTDALHPALYQQLRMLRDKIVAQKDMPVYLVASGTTLDELTRYLPQTLKELAQINGFGKAKIESFGQQFLDIIIGYCQQHKPKFFDAGKDAEEGKKYCQGKS